MKKITHVWHFGESWNHVHLHCQKIDAVRRVGMRGGTFLILNRSDKDRYRSNRKDKIKENKYSVFPVLLLGRRFKMLSNMILLFGILCFFLPQKKVVFHLLRVPMRPFLLAIQIGNRVFCREWFCIMEQEGDLSAESEYLGLTYSEDDYRAEVRVMEQVDGLILMSEEHIRLWESRLGKNLMALALPAVVHEQYRYNIEARDRIRTELNWNDKVVLVYCGNVSCRWQNFPAICELVEDLKSTLNIHFLVLTRELDLAESEMEKCGLLDVSTVISVSPDVVPEYLSAGDVGFFLRDDHLMCRIVTSAKLGEYLACGLPIISTGIAALYPDFSDRQGISIKVDPDTKVLQHSAVKQLKKLVAEHQGDDTKREQISTVFHEEFNERDINNSYVGFIKRIVGDVE